MKPALVLAGLLVLQSGHAGWFGEIFGNLPTPVRNAKSGVEERAEWPVADEIRRLLQRFNPGQAGRIATLNINAQNCERQLRRIDPYARCQLQSQMKPHLGRAGIGADLFRKQGGWWLVAYEGGPLFEAGITGRVSLLSVEHQSTDGMDLEQLSQLLRGAEGEAVCMKLKWQQDIQTICVARREMSLPSVEYLWRGLLRIRSFRALQTRSALEMELRTLEPDQALVIDLRESPGGDLYEAMDCAALFLPPGTPLATLKYREGHEQKLDAPESLFTYEGALKIVIGPDTASAAEVFAGILHYHGRAELIGEKTYGKCVSQAVFPLSDGSRVILTNLEVYFPDGSSCRKQGLSPDSPLIKKS